MRLVNRDKEIINELDQGIRSLSQIAVLYFPSKKKASERLTQMFQAGFVSRFPKPFINEQGRPEYIYCKKGRRPRSYGWISHQLLTTDFRIWLIKYLSKEFCLEFMYPSQFGKKYCNGLFVPDATAIISKGNKRLLYFVEIDCGTEQLSGSAYSFQDKIGLYESYFDDGLYKNDFNYSFRGFRVLIVFESKMRMDQFRGVVQNNFMYCATWESLSKGFWWVKDKQAPLL